MRVYLDSCVAIYLVECREPWCIALEERLAPVADPLPQVHYSELTRLECRVKPMREADHGRLARYDRFFAAPKFVCVPMVRAIFESATELRARYGLKVPDALHLAAALSAGCDEFWTNDRRLAAAAANRIHILPVAEPKT